MSSILVNSSALIALQSLRTTQAALDRTQKETSSGLKISSAADNASTWAIAETMKSDKAVLATIGDSLSGANSVLGIAVAATNAVIRVMNDIKSNVAQAQQPGADRAKIATSLGQLGKQLENVVASASFAGLNALDGSQAGPLQFVSSYANGLGAGASSLGTIDVAITTLIRKGGPADGVLEDAHIGAGASTNFTTIGGAAIANDTAIALTISNADKALSDLITYASELGAAQNSVVRQHEFIKTLGEALTTGVSSLVDAEMTETSTRLQALQTQQQLGMQALSIANQNAQMIVKLFQ